MDYIVSPHAELDLLEIVDYLLDEASVEIAERIQQEFEDTFQRLADHPGIGHRRSDLTTKNVRFHPLYSYLILYHAEAKPLRIVRVLHGSRDLKSLLH